MAKWYARYGIVTHFISDQGTHFMNSLLTELRQFWGATHHFTQEYCPWANGTIERVNRDILNIYRKLLNEFKLTRDQ